MCFSNERAQKCESCKLIYASRTPPEEPPCEEKCHAVVLKEENELIAYLYIVCRNHCITRWNGERDVEIDIDIRSIESAMRMRGVPAENQWEVFNRVRKLFFAIKERGVDGPNAQDGN